MNGSLHLEIMLQQLPGGRAHFVLWRNSRAVWQVCQAAVLTAAADWKFMQLGDPKICTAP